MKKQLIWLIAILVSLTACTPKNQCVISGSVNFGCDSVYIVSEHADFLSAAVPVIDGRFEWKSTTDTIMNIRVCTDSEQDNYCRAILEPGHIIVDIPSGGVRQALPFGTPLNDSIATFENTRSTLNQRSAALKDKMKDASDEEKNQLQEQRDQLYDKSLDMLVDALARNTDNAFGIYLLFEVQHFDQTNLVETPVMKLRDTFPDNFWAKLIGGMVEAKMRSWTGRHYTDLTMLTPDGKEMSLSDVIPNNKYTFVDFWASWCGPCLFDIPYVKEAYEKYHSQGLEIVGVSFDDNADKWKNAIAEEGLPWLHMSDLKGWGCAANGVYGINSIPFSILVDQQGTIVARNLRMMQLTEKLDELYAAQ